MPLAALYLCRHSCYHFYIFSMSVMHLVCLSMAFCKFVSYWRLLCLCVSCPSCCPLCWVGGFSADLPPLPRSAPPHVMARPPVPPNRARYGDQSWVGVTHHPGMPHPGASPHHRPQMGHTVGHHHQIAQHPTGHMTHFSQVSRVSHHQYPYTPQGQFCTASTVPCAVLVL